MAFKNKFKMISNFSDVQTHFHYCMQIVNQGSNPVPLVYCVSYLIIDPSRQRTQTDSHTHILASSRNQIFQPTFSSTVMILIKASIHPVIDSYHPKFFRGPGLPHTYVHFIGA